MVPWKILVSAVAFLNFMAACESFRAATLERRHECLTWMSLCESPDAVIIAPMAACLTVDFFLVKKLRYDVPALYNPEGRYFFWHGFNWRAVATMVLTVPFFIPGMVQSINSDIDVGGIFWLYCPGFIVPYIIGATIFYMLHKIKPDTESMVDQTIDGFVASHTSEAQQGLKERSDGSDESDKEVPV